MNGIRIEVESETLVLSAEGEFDAYSVPALEQALEDGALESRRRFVADLSRVTFLDSTVLGLLVRIVRRMTERGGQARVVLPETTARRIFEITTVDRVLPTAESRVNALRELS